MSRAYDVVIFGASGFTGQFVVQEFAKQNSENQLSWALAGRSEEKLLSVLQKASEQLGWCSRRVLQINISVILVSL